MNICVYWLFSPHTLAGMCQPPHPHPTSDLSRLPNSYLSVLVNIEKYNMEQN
jgi:hypothetical protein